VTVLGKRVLTAVVLLPPVVGVVMFGKGWPFALLVGAVSLLCAGEYFRLFFSSARETAAGVTVTGLAYACGALLPFPAAAAALLCCGALAGFPFVAGGGSPGDKARKAALAVLGAIYVGGFLSTYPRTILLPAGPRWVLLGLVAIIAGDTSAYFVGKAFGRRRLSPDVSPGKTVEGAVAGLAASVVVGGGFGVLFLHGVAPWFGAVAAAVVGAAGQAGDLFESLLKRAAGVKDSGTLLPGHGGMFDRVDALIAAGPVLYLLALLGPSAGGWA